MYLKQATDSQAIMLGPFLDDGDGATAETMSLANTDIKLSKAGADFANKNSGGGTNKTNGFKLITLDATDTATVGELVISCKMSGALPVFKYCWVLEEAIYDAMFGASATLVTKIDAIDTVVDAILVDTGTTLDGKINTIDGIVDAILVDTGTTLDGKIDVIDGIVDSILVDTGTTLDGKINTIDGIVDAILVDTAVIGSAGAGLTAVPWNAAWDAEVQSECTDALNAYDPPTKAEMDAMWTTAMTESYASDGAAMTPAQALYMILCAVSEFSISSTTITGKKLDGSTTAMTWTINSATSPTSRTRAS